jgi:peptidoglycan/xylan/chitin deacetylase (PgdA/CDA1 family)
MYHSIRDEVRPKHPYYGTNTSPHVFRLQMGFLHQNGYSTISLDEAVIALEAHAPVAKSIAITFDDGYRNFYTHAFQILRECGFSATLFLPTSRIGNKPIRFEGDEYLSWGEVRNLQSHGIRIGSHTISHRRLTNLREPEVDRELGDSKRTIEDNIGVRVTSFSYPYAFPETDRFFVKRLKGILERQGYENGVSTILGTAQRDSDRFFLPRIPVNTRDDLPFFQAKLIGAYDWLHAPQVITKFLKRFPLFHATKGNFQREAAR